MPAPRPGYFVLRRSVKPALTAGVYAFDAEQKLEQGATDLTSSAPLPDARTHIEVTAPRFTLPPTEVLSTFPPNQREGAWSSRLPQIVLRRRTLPWDRSPAPQTHHADTPWLALVVIADGEGEVVPNQPIADCVTSGVTLTGRADAEVGSALVVKESVVKRVFPAQDELHLLAHVREVDLSDTELALGDDDGWMAVVVANRLPQPGTRYRACLVNLEGQLPRLASSSDHQVEQPGGAGGTHSGLADAVLAEAQARYPAVGPASAVSAGNFTQVSAGSVDDPWSLTKEAAKKAIKGLGAGLAAHSTPDKFFVAERKLRFPVLVSWTFTCSDAGDFQSRMQGLDVGLVGTVRPQPPQAPPRGRPAPSVLPTGHIALDARSREGDSETLWYRGPLLAMPGGRAVPDADGVLPLRHVSDHGREIGVDGRERVGLAVAFEIGRLLALAEPSVVAALLRWRQAAFEVERRAGLLAINPSLAPYMRAGIADMGHFIAERFLVEIGAGVDVRLGPLRPLADPRVDPLFTDPRAAMTTIFAAMDAERVGAGAAGGPVDQRLGELDQLAASTMELQGLKAARLDARRELEELAQGLGLPLRGETP